jgi:hypothetical protein
MIMRLVKRTKRTMSKMKKIFPIVFNPGNVFGVFPKTTASAPVDIVAENHGLPVDQPSAPHNHHSVLLTK